MGKRLRNQSNSMKYGRDNQTTTTTATTITRTTIETRATTSLKLMTSGSASRRVNCFFAKLCGCIWQSRVVEMGRTMGGMGKQLAFEHLMIVKDFLQTADNRLDNNKSAAQMIKHDIQWQ